MRKDAVVIGAGAAGLMAAIEAGKRGRSVAVLERSKKIGKKIRISGGGRCNFTNLHVSADHFISQNPHFCKSALAGFTPQDFIALVEKHGIAYHEKKMGQLFCDKTAEEIIRLLEAECRAAGVEIKVGCGIRTINKRGDFFELRTDRGDFQSSSLVVACGGLSIPNMGATSLGYEIARQFGLKVVPCSPGLVPLTWTTADLAIYRELAGVSVDAIVVHGRRNYHEAVLFTHRGLSGPAILQISSSWTSGKAIYLDLLPGTDVVDEAELSKLLPRRFVQIWLAQNAPAKAALSELLHCWKVTPAGTEGYEKAEVTVGGVDTRELSSKTMETLKVPGLFFIGEVLDVTGDLGGFNFQWAWASGFAAGQAI